MTGFRLKAGRGPRASGRGLDARVGFARHPCEGVGNDAAHRRRVWFRARNGHVLPSKYASLSYTENEKLTDRELRNQRRYVHGFDVLISKCVMELSIAQRKQP